MWRLQVTELNWQVDRVAVVSLEGVRVGEGGGRAPAVGGGDDLEPWPQGDDEASSIFNGCLWVLTQLLLVTAHPSCHGAAARQPPGNSPGNFTHTSII